MPIIEYFNGETHEYLSVEECIRRNGHRHLERAIAYASAGYPDRYYQGSMAKAKRAYLKADLFKTPEWMIKAYGHKLVDFVDSVNDAIMHGTAYYMNGSRIDPQDLKS